MIHGCRPNESRRLGKLWTAAATAELESWYQRRARDCRRKGSFEDPEPPNYVWIEGIPKSPGAVDKGVSSPEKILKKKSQETALVGGCFGYVRGGRFRRRKGEIAYCGEIVDIPRWAVRMPATSRQVRACRQTRPKLA